MLRAVGVAHFHEKLFKLKLLINTDAGRRMAEDHVARDSWRGHIWQGNVDKVIAEHQTKLGLPPKDSSESDPREIVRRATVYYRNHRSRMNYPQYRLQGYH